MDPEVRTTEVEIGDPNQDVAISRFLDLLFDKFHLLRSFQKKTLHLLSHIDLQLVRQRTCPCVHSERHLFVDLKIAFLPKCCRTSYHMDMGKPFGKASGRTFGARSTYVSDP